jgi:chemotaxis protein MotB
MTTRLMAATAAIPFAALVLSACVSQSAYEQQTQQLQQAQTQLAAAQAQAASQQAEITNMQQEDKWVVAGDMLFPEGGYRLSANGKHALNQYVPRLQALQNGKVVVYGYTDDKPVGRQLQRAGIANNVDLSSRRADDVVAYLQSQGVNPNIISAKGFGDTHPVASNDTLQGRAQNRRIEIVLEGPGA